MKREALPILSSVGQQFLEHYEQVLRTEEDLSVVTSRNYLRSVGQFTARSQARSQEGQEEVLPFTPVVVATAIISAYRVYLHHSLQLKLVPIDRSLVNLKRYSAWLTETEQIKQDPAKVMKSVEHEFPTRPPKRPEGTSSGRRYH